MKRVAIISMLILTVAIVLYAIDPLFAAIGPIGITQETLGTAIKDDAVTRFNMMSSHGRFQEELGRAIRDNAQVRREWNTNIGRLQEELGKVIRDDAVLRQRGAGNMQEELGRTIVNLALLNHKVLRHQENLGIAIREADSFIYNSMITAGRHQERLGEAIKNDAVTRFRMAGTLGLNQEEISVPVGEDEALPYTTFLLVGMTLGATAACFFAWTIACPKYEGAEAKEEETEVSIAA